MFKKLISNFNETGAAASEKPAATAARISELEARLSAIQENALEKAPPTVQSIAQSTPPTQLNSQHSNVDNNLLKTISLAALTEVIGGVVHEINNPLQVIMGRTQIARMGKKTEESLEIIESQTMRIANLIRGLQSFASRDSKTEQIDISTTINAVMNLVKTQFYKRSIQIEVEIGKVSVFMGNPITFQQIVLSGMLSAKRRIEYNGQLKISVKSSEKNMLELEIRDSAPIMDEQLIRNIGKPFMEALEDPEAGDHYGLIASIEMVRHLGGAASLTATPPQGNMLKFNVPIGLHKDVNLYALGAEKYSQLTGEHM